MGRPLSQDGSRRESSVGAVQFNLLPVIAMADPVSRRYRKMSHLKASPFKFPS
ncbi:MAG: hypothetical protein QOI34_825 [Verrucomicrobiota bacterium]